MNNRIKQLREALCVTQDVLGKAMGITKSGVSALEYGTRNVTDKHIRMLELVYNVNPDWLRTGEGNMFNEDVSEDYLIRLQHDKHLSDLDMHILHMYIDASPAQRKILSDAIDTLIELRNS